MVPAKGPPPARGTPDYKSPLFRSRYEDELISFLGAVEIFVSNNHLTKIEIDGLKAKFNAAVSVSHRDGSKDDDDKNSGHMGLEATNFPACNGTAVASCTDITSANTCGNYYLANVCLHGAGAGVVGGVGVNVCTQWGGQQCWSASFANYTCSSLYGSKCSPLPM